MNEKILKIIKFLRFSQTYFKIKKLGINKKLRNSTNARQTEDGK